MNNNSQNLSDLSLLTGQVFEQSSVAMAILDADFIIVTTNPAFSKITGFESSVACDEPISLIYDELRNPGVFQDMQKNLSESDSFSCELSILKSNAQFFPALMVVDAIRHNQVSNLHYLLLLMDISEQKQRESELRFYSEVDPLTNLGNRKFLLQSLENAINAANRFNYTVGLMFLDLDGFKQINDRFGHGEGDKVLLEVAQRLRHCVRQVDSVARLGGDEFVVILNGTSTEMIDVTAKRIIDFLTITVTDQTSALQVSASIGISLYPQDSKNPLVLLKYADEAMYKEKSKGKRQFCWHLDVQNI
jgi:diguanylate cyclase (GGDEF)-like protein/PAS domain S-box-containing protein